MDKVKEVTIAIIAVLILPLLIAVPFFVITGTPDVVFSHETGECVKVIYADGTMGSCESLPNRYNVLWGK